jgi:hypothetical protein
VPRLCPSVPSRFCRPHLQKASSGRSDGTNSGSLEGLCRVSVVSIEYHICWMRRQHSVQADSSLLKRKRGRPCKASYTEINKAIRRFITRTEKIVQKVTPSAQIVAADDIRRKRGRPRKAEVRVGTSAVRLKRSAEAKYSDKSSIVVPSFRGNFQLGRSEPCRLL